MSNGAFTLSKYETDNDDIVPIKLQPETLTATFDSTANAAPSGSVSAGFPSADVSRSKRAIGIHARQISVKITTPNSGYLDNSLVRIPVLTKSVYNATSKGDTVTCAAGTGTVAGKTPEFIV